MQALVCEAVCSCVVCTSVNAMWAPVRECAGPGRETGRAEWGRSTHSGRVGGGAPPSSPHVWAHVSAAGPVTEPASSVHTVGAW